MDVGKNLYLALFDTVISLVESAEVILENKSHCCDNVACFPKLT